MISKRNSVKLTCLIVGTLLLFSVSSAWAAKVIFSGNTASGIQNLQVGDKYYDVEFVYQSGNNVYGTPPVFDFDNKYEADAAVDAAVGALNSVPAVTGVGPNSHPGFLIGYGVEEITEPHTKSRQGVYRFGTWYNSGFDMDEADDVKSYAVFTEAGDPSCTDKDGDTFAVEGGACGKKDCNDNDPKINPGAKELCDGIDNNCNGTVDGGNVCEATSAEVTYSGNTASGIQNLMLNGSYYNVEFVFQSGIKVYGTPPVFDFNNRNDANAAVEAVIDALNNVPTVTRVGPSSRQGFLIGYSQSIIGGERYTNAYQGFYLDDFWVNSDWDTDEADDVKSYAVFTPVGQPPQPPSCTDNDGDTYAIEGGSCGLVDCNDNNANINPGAKELCDGIDNNCNGIIDGGTVCRSPGGTENLGWLNSIFLMLRSN